MDGRHRRFLELVEPQRERLWRYLRASVHGDDELVRDVMADTIAQALESMSQLREPTMVVAWLFTIARRTLQRYREQRRRTEALPPDHHETVASTTTSPDVLADVAMLHAMLARLTPLLRETLVLSDLADLPLADIAAMHGVSESAVKSRVSRARDELRRMAGEPLHRQSSENRHVD